MSVYLSIPLRLTIIYLFALAMMRLSGKRSIRNLTSVDTIVAFIVSDMFDNGIFASTPMAQVMVGMATIIIIHVFVTFAASKSKLVDRIVSSSPTTVVKSARFVKDGLEKERTSKEEVQSELRMEQEENIKEIKEAAWEPSGQVSVIKKEEYKEAQKKDLDRLLDLFE